MKLRPLHPIRNCWSYSRVCKRSLNSRDGNAVKAGFAAICKYPPSKACNYTQKLHNQSNRSTCMFRSISYYTSAWISVIISHRSHLQFKPHPSSNLSPPLTTPQNATPSTPPKVSKSFQTHRICRPSGSQGATFIHSKPQLKSIAFHHENRRSYPVSTIPSIHPSNNKTFKR